MALELNTCHGEYNRTRRPSLSGIRYFAVHYTAGTGSAKNNCLYFAGGDRRSSADVFVDKDGAAWEYNNVMDGWYTWHCGDGGGRYGITNSNSVGVEVVSSGEDFTAAQIATLGALYAHYCGVLGRKLEIVRHYDASRKSCPAPYVDAGKWKALKEGIVKASEGDWFDMATKAELKAVVEAAVKGTASDVAALKKDVAALKKELAAVKKLEAAVNAQVCTTGDVSGRGIKMPPLEQLRYMAGKQQEMYEAVMAWNRIEDGLPELVEPDTLK